MVPNLHIVLNESFVNEKKKVVLISSVSWYTLQYEPYIGIIGESIERGWNEVLFFGTASGLINIIH